MAWVGDKWVPEDDSASSRVAALTSKDSAFMRSAAAAGERSANRRGVINSTMGIGAGVAAGLAAATPIASQDAAQISAHNTQYMANQQTDKQIALGDRQIASGDRQAQAQTIATLGNTYTAGIGNTLQNDKIPDGARNAAQSDMAQLYRDQQAKIAALYNMPAVTWGSGG